MTDLSDIDSLAALMSEDPTTALLMLSPRDIDPDPDQPRRTFDEGDLSGLAESIAAQGVIQPIVVSVHPTQPGRYMLIAGERRWKAALLADMTMIPAVLRDGIAPADRLAVQLIENLDRTPLDILEESQAVLRLLTTHGKSAREVAESLGKSASWVSVRKKIGDNRAELDLFVTTGVTTDPETLCMIADIRRLDPKLYGEYLLASRLTRNEVRMALDDVKARQAPPRDAVPPPPPVPLVILPPALFDDSPAGTGGLEELRDLLSPYVDHQEGAPVEEEDVPPTLCDLHDGSSPDEDRHPPHPKDDLDDAGSPPPQEQAQPVSNDRPAAPPPASAPEPAPAFGNPDMARDCQQAERAISDAWNLKVKAVYTGRGEEGELRITFRDLNDLKNLVNCLS